jgi:transmembrane sensor
MASFFSYFYAGAPSLRKMHDQQVKYQSFKQSQPDGEIIPAARPKHSFTLIRSLFTGRQLPIAATLAAAICTGWYLWRSQAPWKTVTAGNSNQTFTLPDGSTLLLRKGSTVQYPVRFNKEERFVQLSGEAFFQIRHNERQPFRIITPHAEVKVLGTTFLVHTQQTADEVVVVTGKVQVSDKNTGSQVLLGAGDRVVLQNDQIKQSAVTDSNYLAWQTGILDFKQATLRQVLEELTHYYGVRIAIEEGGQPATGALQVTVRFRDQSLEQVLKEIRQITGLSMKKETGSIVLFQQ